MLGPAMNAKILLPLLALASACGAATPPAQTETSSPTEPSSEAPSGATEDSPKSAADKDKAPTNAGSPASSDAPAAAAPAAPTVTFPDHASVDAAIKAVPQGLARVNMAQDALEAPLMDHKRYEACKVPNSVHFTIRAAVYDGAAVGVDVTMKPKNAKLESCVDQLVRSMTWPKVPSLNTVTANY